MNIHVQTVIACALMLGIATTTLSMEHPSTIKPVKIDADRSREVRSKEMDAKARAKHRFYHATQSMMIKISETLLPHIKIDKPIQIVVHGDLSYECYAIPDLSNPTVTHICAFHLYGQGQALHFRTIIEEPYSSRTVIAQSCKDFERGAQYISKDDRKKTPVYFLENSALKLHRDQQ